MTSAQYLARHLLIAMPALDDPNFARGVTMICQHSESGAMGLTINRPSPLPLSEVMRQVGISRVAPEIGMRKVLVGGPVESERGFVLHNRNGSWNSSAALGDDLAITVSSDILHAIAEGEGPSRYLVLLGYAGWSAGQLEREVRDNAWLTVKPNGLDLLFETPFEARWESATHLLGIDIGRLSGGVGHA